MLLISLTKHTSLEAKITYHDMCSKAADKKLQPQSAILELIKQSLTGTRVANLIFVFYLANIAKNHEQLELIQVNWKN